MTAAAPLDLGFAHTAEWTVWSPDRELNPQFEGLADVDPAGVIITHPRPDGAGQCKSAVSFEPSQAHKDRWGGPARHYWQVESLDPLTISPSVLCRTCGDHGFIRAGRWVSA